MLSLSLLLLCAAPVTDGPKLASPAWNAVNVKPELAAFYAEHLAQALRARGFRVVTQGEIATLLGQERQRQLLGCSDASQTCMAELSNALGCDATLMVSLAKLDDVLRAQVKVLSAQDARVVVETSVEASGEKKMLAELDDAAQIVADRMNPSRVPTEVKQTSSVRSRWWVPAVSGAAVAVAGGVMLGLAASRSGQLDTELSSNGLTDNARGMAAEGKTFQTVGWVGLGVGVAALAGAGAMYFLGSDSSVAVAVTPQGAYLGIAGVFP